VLYSKTTKNFGGLMAVRKSMDFFGTELTMETGRMAKQAHGAIFLTFGETQILVTAVSSYDANENAGFFPLTVEYREKKYAAGKMPGGFIKREGRPGTKEILSARLIDRPIRPLFPEGYKNETQVIINVLSHDGDNDPDVLATLAASTALNISDIPFAESVASVRVARIDGEFIINPTYDQMEEADIELVVAATMDNIAMIEGEAAEVPEADMIEAVRFGHEAIKQLITFQNELVAEFNVEKREVSVKEYPENLKTRVEELTKEKISEANKIQEKADRRAKISEIQEEAIETLLEEDEENENYLSYIKDVIHDIEKYDVRGRIISENLRLDGRNPEDIRQLTSETDVLKRTHGSALFTRGQTQALGVCTLGTKQDEQVSDALEGEKSQSYYLHYNFPPFCTGEVKRIMGVSRREIGHGHLAERSFKPVLPSDQSFPYSIRLVSEVLESNGSSSMATICASSLALHSAGVPVKSHVAGIAMGLIKEGDDVVVLTDILGDEDHLGDMDFKVAGTREGITAFQMDIKINGISYEIMEQALVQAQAARYQILDVMEEAIPQPNTELSEHAPRIIQFTVPTDKIGMIIGPGGKQIREIIEVTEAKVDIDDNGLVSIFSPSQENGKKAEKMIRDIIAEAEPGTVYDGVVQKITDFGAFIEVLPGIDGLLHISEYSWEKTANLADHLKQGDKIKVLCKSVEKGRVSLSRKALLEKPEGYVEKKRPPFKKPFNKDKKENK
jgi:polyribonucleotide nucleotidyltransferase